MSVTKPHLELSREVTACEVRIAQLERSLLELKNEYNEYVKNQESRSYTRSQIIFQGLYGLVTAIIGGVVVFITNRILS